MLIPSIEKAVHPRWGVVFHATVTNEDDQTVWTSPVMNTTEDTAREEAEIAVEHLCYRMRHQLELPL